MLQVYTLTLTQHPFLLPRGYLITAPSVFRAGVEEALSVTIFNAVADTRVQVQLSMDGEVVAHSHGAVLGESNHDRKAGSVHLTSHLYGGIPVLALLHLIKTRLSSSIWPDVTGYIRVHCKGWYAYLGSCASLLHLGGGS